MKVINMKKIFKFIKNHDEDIHIKVKEYFEDPEIFLHKNNKIIIGKSFFEKLNYNFIKNISNNDIKKNSSKKLNSLKDINKIKDISSNINSLQNNTIKINNKEDLSPKNNNEIKPINKINTNKEIDNKEMYNRTFYENNKNNNDYKNYIENNKQNLFNKKTAVYKKIDNLKKNDENNNGETSGNSISKKSDENKKYLVKKIKKQKNELSDRNKEIKIIKKKKAIILPYTSKAKRPLSVGIHYKFKTSKEIVDSYKIGQNREEESKIKGTNHFMPNEVDAKIKIKYLTQEKKLKQNYIRNNEDRNFSSYLSKKCHKKQENLLYNNIEDFRIKRQLLDYLENKKNLSEKLGDHYWYVNLRRPSILTKPRGLYLNIGKEENQIWEPMVEYPMKNVEIIKKAETPHKKRNTFETFLKDQNLYPNNLFNPNKKNLNVNKLTKKDKNKMPNLSEMNDMIIRGKNMISFEKDNFLNFDEKSNLTGHKYRVFKDPREDNSKYNQDCLYKYNYKCEGKPYKTNLGVKRTKRNKTPNNVDNRINIIKFYYSDEKGKEIKNKK